MKPAVATSELPLATALGDFLAGLATDHHDRVRTTAAALVRAEAEGHACITVTVPETLLASGVAGRPGELKPLICDGERVYLRRMFLHEGAIAAALKARSRAPDGPVDTARLGQFLRACGLAADAETDWQAVAVIAGLLRPLVVISGGPGTGKTRTAAVLLAAIRELQPGLKTALAAPTGKAAARLGESIARTWTQLDCGPGEVPTAMTLHRLLGASADGRRFRHGPDNPLAADLVLVDEASMVDLTLMGRLVSALRPEARLVLLGDKDQLASVEAGYVLGDLCEAAGLNRLSPAFAEVVQTVTGVAPPAVEGGTNTAIELQRNHRFGEGNAIRRISSLVRTGNADDTLAALAQLTPADAVGWHSARTAGELHEALRGMFTAKVRARGQAADPAQALAGLGRFQILCAIKQGPFGRDAVNETMEALVELAGLRRRGQVWYRGRPVLITANAPQLELFNGDLGVVWPDAAGALQVWFAGPNGIRSLAPSRLPAHETAFALTVHKSQGSEFDEVMLVLPPRPSPVCTRELLYTGLTRARTRVTLLASAASVAAAIGFRSERSSGLAERLKR